MTITEFRKHLLFLEEQVRDIRDGLASMSPEDLSACKTQLWWFRDVANRAVQVWAVADEKASRIKETA
jgi:hypothetical protein